MAEPTAPRAASSTIVLIHRETRGYSVQAWQPPADGWTPLGEAMHFDTLDEANTAASPIVAGDAGTLGFMITPPGWVNPFRKAGL